MKQPCCLKKHNPTYGQIDNNELCEVNLLFVMYVKWIVIIITHAATNGGWHLTLNVCNWSFKSLNWIVHMILFILGKIWSKGSNLTSLPLVNIFTDVNAEALNIKSYRGNNMKIHFASALLRQCFCRGSAEAKYIFILLPRHFICRGKKCWNSRAVWV